MFGPQDILRPPHARSRPFCYPSLPAHAQITRDYLVYILSSLELGCAGVRQGLRAIHPSFLGSEKAPPDEAHTRSRFSLIFYLRACAPGNVCRHGHGHIRGALTSPLGLLLRPGGGGPLQFALRKLISVDLGLAVEGNARTENTKLSRTLLHFSVCLGSFTTDLSL